MSDPFIGQIIQIGWNWAPEGWALCSGQLLPVQQNSALFSLLGTTFGGDGRVNFGIPDLRSRVVIGTGQGQGLSPYNWGQKAGQETVTLTSQQLPTHNHPATFTPTGGGGPITVNAQLQALQGVVSSALKAAPASGALLANTDDPTSGWVPLIYAPAGTAGTAVNLGGLSVTAQGGGGITGGSVAVGNAGASAPTPTLPPYIAITSVIALTGIYPPRP